MNEALTLLFDRDLKRLRTELEAFQQDAHVWTTTGSISNSAGNLCLHLVGNLKTYIARQLGGHPYVRDRDAEFSLKSVPRQTLIDQVEETRTLVIGSLQKLTTQDLEATYPEEVLGYPMNTGFFLIHLAAHLSYHLGQINYIRRMQE